MIEELEKKAMQLEKEFEKAPSFQKQKELNVLWDQIHKLFIESKQKE